ncbi:neurexin protein binding [Desmophyllum pertusum]|uniref:Carboxylic ester hydrolase n=1 Tax=Desmophyllum pertusum TaxID=174260 RepID=A0A9X0A4A4_9CNID|nr:neurexin protein binding [Desmophyllum pertusum]
MTSQCVFSILLVLLGLGTVKTRHLHLCPGEVLTFKCDALKNGNIIGDVKWKVNDFLSSQWTTVARCNKYLNCEILESQAADGINVLGISNGTLTVQRLSPRNATTRSHVNFQCLVDANNVHSHLVKINLEVECVSTRVGADENLTGHLIDMVRPGKQVKDVKLYSMVGKKLKFASCSSTANCCLSFENIHHPRPAFWKRLKQYDGSILLTRIQADDDGLVIRVEWNVSPLHHFQSFMLKIRLLQAPQGPDNTSSTFNQSSKIEFMLQDYDTVPMVKTESGKVVGKIETLPLGKSVHTYLGIPYAEPPVGELRFAAPNPAKPWSEIKKAIKYGAACPAQPDFPISHLSRSDAGEENEDCLYLNVFVPSTVKPDVKMAVMVWIHGGAFTLGSSTEYPGHILASFNDVIVVTFNYRLGILGFFNIPGTDFKGNYGMHDQILALKWVQANIASFGGDPNRVTIFGESSGGMSVSLHLISPLSKGLFRRAIMQSGASSSPLLTRKETSPKTLKELKKIANCKLNTGLIQCLRSKSAKKIISFQTTMSSSSPTKLPQITTPVLDGNFLPDQPQKLFKQGKFPNRDIDVIIGFTSHERALSVALKPGNLTQDGISREEF